MTTLWSRWQCYDTDDKAAVKTVKRTKTPGDWPIRGQLYTRLEAIATRLEAVASKLEAIAIRLEAIATDLTLWTGAFAAARLAGYSM